MTERMYLHDAATTGEAIVTEIVHDHSAVRLNKTWFHPQGGGQQSDEGTINGVNVIRVIASNGNIDHVVSDLRDFSVGTTVAIVVDSLKRKLNARYHSAGHLIASLIERQFQGCLALQGHQWPGEARVEFGGNLPTKASLDDFLQAALQDATASDMPVIMQGHAYESRSIQIGDFSSIPCGGTHVLSTQEIGAIVVKSVKVKQGRLRISYELVDLP